MLNLLNFLTLVSVWGGARYDILREAACSRSELPGICEWMTKLGDMSVETDCRFRVRVGLWSHGERLAKEDEARLGPALLLRYSDGSGATLEPHSNPKTHRLFVRRTPILCELASDVTLARPVIKDYSAGPVLLMVASSIDYLFRLWPYFCNKCLWAQSISMRVILWIGELPEGIATTISEDCKNSSDYTAGGTGLPKKIETQRRLNMGSSFYAGTTLSKAGTTIINSNHHIKLMAIYAALAYTEPKVTGIFYTDMDTHVQASDFSNAKKAAQLATIHFENEVDVLFSSVKYQLFWYAKSHNFYIRDSLLGRSLICGWLHWRCGFKDQYALWHTSMKLADAAGCHTDHFYQNEMLLHTYEEVHRYKDKVSMQNFMPSAAISCKQRRLQCPQFLFNCPSRYSMYDVDPFIHRTIPGDQVRNFSYYDPIGSIKRIITVQDNFADLIVSTRGRGGGEDLLLSKLSISSDRIDPIAFL